MRTGDRSHERFGDDAAKPHAASSKAGGGSLSKSVRYLRWGLGSGALAGVGGGVLLLQGLRALRRGDWERGVRRFLVGGVFVTVGIEQRRTSSERQVTTKRREPTDPSTPAESATADSEDIPVGTPESHQSVGTGQDVSDSDASTTETDQQSSGLEQRTTETTQEFLEPEAYTRLGSAAFDRQSAQIPVPQRAFNQEFLSLDAEAFWGIRDTDDLVILSGFYDAIEDLEEGHYVASSEIDDERMLKIPDRILNHWEDVVGGGTGVTGGDDIVIAGPEESGEYELLVVVPDQEAEDVLGED